MEREIENNNYENNNNNGVGSQPRQQQQRRGGAKGNRRAWGSKGRGPQRPPVNTTGFQANNSTTAVLTGNIPQGQYLSKTSSPLSNDPLSEKAYFPGPSEEFRAIASREKIYSTCTNLPELMEQSYVRIGSISPSFAKTVPRSAYDYYIAVITAYRLLLVHRKCGGQMTHDEQDFIAQMEHSEYAIPKSIGLYLSGIGNTKAPKSREIEFAYDKPSLVSEVLTDSNEKGELMNMIEIPGFFGPILGNLGLYASYPSTAVYVMAVIMDLKKTQNRSLPASWDLPGEFRAPGHPLNTNCLG